jgi:hypothetical protein
MLYELAENVFTYRSKCVRNMHELKQTETSFRPLYLLFSHYRVCKSARDCIAQNPVKTAGYVMQDFGTSVSPRNHLLSQAVLCLHQICKPHLYRYVLVLHKKRTICSFDSNFRPHSDWFTAQKDNAEN